MAGSVTHARALKILVPSIIDPRTHIGGAGVWTRAFLKLLQPLASRIDYAVPTSPLHRFNRARQFISVAKALVSSLPSKAEFTYSRTFLKSIREKVNEENYDLVLINGGDLLWLLPELPATIPRVLVAHNIEHQLFLSQINQTRPWPGLLRRALMRDHARFKDYEMSGMAQVRNVIFLSGDDQALALSDLPALKTLIVPPIFDYQGRRKARDGLLHEPIEIGFVANFAWWPNRSGLQWFLNEVFPSVQSSVRLHLFGPGSLRASPNHPNIVKHGFQPSIERIWQAFDFMICPIFSGGGVNVKLAEAIYNRVPVLATSFAARGLPLDTHPGIVLLDGADEWIHFLSSPDAEALRRRQPSAEMAEAFAMKSYAEPAHRFIREILDEHR